MTLAFGSFLAGSVISLLIPVGLLIAIGLWHARAFTHVPDDPGQTSPHAAGAAEKDGLGVIPQDAPQDPQA